MLLLQNRAKRLEEGKTAKRTKEEDERIAKMEKMELEVLHGEEPEYIVEAEKAVQRVLEHYYVLGVEQVVAAPEWGIAGTIDFMGLNKKNHNILIGDWKTSGSVVSNFRFGSFETPCMGCLNHLPNSKYYRYAMQIFIYGEILKREKYFEKGFFDAAIKTAVEKAKEKKKAKGEPLQVSLYHKTENISHMLEYGIVQLSKDEQGQVVTEYKDVSESTILPTDRREMDFLTLLQDVMKGV
ncbi:hypothetical protein AGDE_10524 [Angomonas deanei]|uniref:PD-(D/E)XK nuclease superfamily n=1 Tax=Angomonas deanei TaxID=59799 RepID=A0A7G2CQT4_9TRYP|nr:hypothetical protein AGDE_10524 [Angomonas deanei]CAD2220863.1 hypothetical protein, conserved [Angomonas deanei]|eukprot:EPY28153.1 hypothetical protein AGDE_10524 [Angomonas deanei]